MNNTTVYFYDKTPGEIAVDHFGFTNQDFLDYIEEQLYILWELTPTVRNWRSLFRRFKYAKFAYHETSLVNMREYWLNSDGSKIRTFQKRFNMEVHCIKCYKPVPFGTGYGLKKTYCRKRFGKKLLDITTAIFLMPLQQYGRKICRNKIRGRKPSYFLHFQNIFSIIYVEN